MRTFSKSRPMYRGQPSRSSTRTSTCPFWPGPGDCPPDTSRGSSSGAVDDGDLAGEAIDREQVGPVRGRLDLEHVLGEREHVRERRPGLGAVLEHHDPAVVLAELQLALGEDHPVRDLAAELRGLELLAVGEHRARQRDRDLGPGAEVPGAADDLPRLALPHVDLAQLQPVCVRVLAGLEHEPDPVEAEVAVLVRDSAVEDPLHLAASSRGAKRAPRPRRPPRRIRAASSAGYASELAQEAEVVFPEQADVRDAVAQHRDPLEADAEREAGHLFRVVADVAEDVRIDEP